MSRIGPSLGSLGDRWRYALVGGLLSVPFTTASYWQTGSELSLSPVLFGSLLAGYLAKRKTGSATGVGARAGVVGGLPALWLLADVVAATSGLGGPAWFIAAGTVFAVVAGIAFAILGLGLAALVGAVGARVGAWVAESTGPRQPPSAAR
ncbi:DUF5518 domain-containing protein [Candidatus Halobonum tyrrellensis]|uniref:DUF5518 domain-containing protein n=1 Tax=Candidatus Halobonum tyrrellensis TaxID=1431545 RepID=UPI001F2EB781|nr:DUF5518 domain-containing protein [Candidatus Halobonum tyrrellensis]